LAIGIVFSCLVHVAGQVSIAVNVRVTAQGRLCTSVSLTYYDASVFFGRSFVGCVRVVGDLSYVVYYVDVVVDCLSILGRGASRVIAASSMSTASRRSGVVCVSSVAAVAVSWIGTVERI